MLKPMLPTLSAEHPKGSDWVYEVKYDGFRCILIWTKSDIQLLSRNGRSLNEQFPEIIQYCTEIVEKMENSLPLTFDGELVLLSNKYKSNFADVQIRGRLRKKEKIADEAKKKPCQFLIFDLLEIADTPLRDLAFVDRKQKLFELFTKANLSLVIDPLSKQLLGCINYSETFENVWDNVQLNDGEGAIAKRKSSSWEEGKRTTGWLKIKNYKIVTCFITAYQKDNGYFHVAVYQSGKILPIGLFKHGLSIEQTEALLQTIRANKREESKTFIEMDPAICVDIQCLELYEGQLREPSFANFRLDISAEACTWEAMSQALRPLPPRVDITSPEKVLWEELHWTKKQYLQYLQTIYQYSHPFLQNRALTVIRYPHGVHGEAFYQKNCPDYAPSFVDTAVVDDINYVVCNSLETLLWLGNQAAIELHLPFQTIHSTSPSEIVFDFDPPSRKEFSLAVKAALITKEILDGLSLTCFVKTSGNKGLQLYLPLPEYKFTFEDTRVFTSFIAHYLTTNYPDQFTTERMKKKRGNRLYVDYIQHAEGKTIIAPYSARGNREGLVATPLFWEEVDENLRPEYFPISTIEKRLGELGCPFANYFSVKEEQPFMPVLEFLKKGGLKN